MNPKKILSQEEKQYFLSLKRTDITHQLLQDLLAEGNMNILFLIY